MTTLLFALSLAVPVAPPDDVKKSNEEFQKTVDAAREKAVKFLKAKQDKDGSWEESASKHIAEFYEGGTTALVTLALLEAGVPANAPAIAKAVAYLLPLRREKTYVVSLQTQVLARVDAKKYAKEVQANADWLLNKKLVDENKKLRGWSYPLHGITITDYSNTHFAVMGLHTAAQAGATVDTEIWKQIRDYVARTQVRADGLNGWRYHNGFPEREPITRSMTTVGLLCLAVAAMYDKDAKGPHPAFDKGMVSLLGDKLRENEKKVCESVMWMVTAELGRVLGANEFKAGEVTKPWYREWGVKILNAQQADGSFKVGDRSIDAKEPLVATACALYFFGPPKK